VRFPFKRRTTTLRSIAPTRRGWWFLALGVGCLYFAYSLMRSELLYLGTFLVVLPVVSLVTVRLRKLRTTVVRSFSPAVAQAGHPVSVTLDISNLSSTATAAAAWRDTLPWAPFATPTAVLVSKAPKSSALRLSYQLVPATRGMVEIGPLRIDFTDPFGLARGAVRLGLATPLAVTPEVIHFADEAINVASDEGTNRALQRRAQGGEDDLMTRQYRRGDALRRVHWRASAHHGELMVRQEEQRSHAEARIVLDTLQHNYRDRHVALTPGEIESPSFEWAVSFTASLGLFLERAGYVVQVVETGVTQLAEPDRPEEFLESLAAVQLVAERAETASILRDVERPDQAQGTVFVVLSDPDSLTLDNLISRRHLFGLAVIFLVGQHNVNVIQTLREAGWLCVAVTAETPVQDAWSAIGRAEGDADGQQ
jgi:uncharacterized protein (DUF58 family)